MEIIIKGSPAEIAELRAGLRAVQATGAKESAPQPEATKRKTNQEIFEKQMELLSKASEECLLDMSLYHHLPALTSAMLNLSQHLF